MKVTVADSAYGDNLGGFDGAIIRIHPKRLISFGIATTDAAVRPSGIDTRNVG